MQNWFVINDIERLDTPALVVYPDRVQHNINLLKTMVNDVSRLRPHVKTHKCKEVALMNIAAGINKFKCATIAEAEMLGMCKAADVLLAYQPTGPKLDRFINLITHYHTTKYSCLIDNVDSAKEIATEAVSNLLTIDVYIDLNVGMNRTGINAGDAFELYETCSHLDGINLLGLHAYDGHIHDVDITVRTAKCEIAFAPVKELITQLKAKGYQPKIIAGGSPTFPVHAAWDEAECSPGTFVYWDANYQQAYPEQPFLPAAVLVTRVVSLPDATKICLDLGHKSVSAENPIDKRVKFFNAEGLTPISQSEEHLVLEVGEGHGYKPGDVLYGLPWHVCPSVALYERAYIISNNTITCDWKTIARDRKIKY